MGKPRQTQSDKWRQRDVVMRYRAFADDMRGQVRGHLEPKLALAFYIPMPKSWSEKKRTEMLGRPHQQKPDIDNLIKSVLDVLCTDDSYIHDVHARKFWATDGAIEIEE